MPGPTSSRMLGYLPPYMRLASVMVALATTEADELAIARNEAQVVLDQMLVATATSWGGGLEEFEAMLHLPAGNNLTDEERRSRIFGRLRASLPPTMWNVRQVALTYPNGDAEPIYDPDAWVMQYRFTNLFGRPTNIVDLQAELTRITDAQVFVTFEYRFLLRGEIKEQGTLRGDIKTAGITRGELKAMRPEDLP